MRTQPRLRLHLNQRRKSNRYLMRSEWRNINIGMKLRKLVLLLLLRFSIKQYLLRQSVCLSVGWGCCCGSTLLATDWMEQSHFCFLSIYVRARTLISSSHQWMQCEFRWNSDCHGSSMPCGLHSRAIGGVTMACTLKRTPDWSVHFCIHWQPHQPHHLPINPSGLLYDASIAISGPVSIE